MKFEIYQGNIMGHWYWRLRARNGKIVADGAESYASQGNARRAARRFEQAMLTPEFIEIAVLKTK